MGCFHSRGQHLCKFIATKESICIRKEFNSHSIGLGHQHGRPFIVLGHQYGHRNATWKHSIAFFAVLVGVAVRSSRRRVGEGGMKEWTKSRSKNCLWSRALRKNTLERFFQAVQNKHISSDMCSPTWETMICVRLPGKHISLLICVPPPGETHIPSDMCSPTWETRIPSGKCSPTWETRLPSDMWTPTWRNTYP